MIDVIEVADRADMIINGYAFTKEADFIKVLNLNNPEKAVMIDKTGDVLETSMDDIEIQVVKRYWDKNKELLED
ncbi:DUF7723 family protein [Frisingicoccus sp.]|uniref:DUF7723 family protein n=1 Tax=Frisingicoccus sp. TaxID=1918627 RepID=UPI003AB918EC